MVIESLSNAYGEIADNITLAEALITTAENAVSDNLTDYFDELMYSKDDSFLEELDELNVSVSQVLANGTMEKV